MTDDREEFTAAPVMTAAATARTMAAAAMTGAWGGLIGAITTWLVVAAYEEFPENSGITPGINVDTLGPDALNAQLAGCLVAILLSGLLCFIVTAIQKPEPYDWNLLREGITLVEKPPPRSAKWEQEHSPEFLATARAWISYHGTTTSIFLILIWPLICLPWGVFPPSLFSLWASLALVWGFFGAFIIIALPIYENWDTFVAVASCTPLQHKKVPTKDSTSASDPQPRAQDKDNAA